MCHISKGSWGLIIGVCVWSHLQGIDGEKNKINNKSETFQYGFRIKSPFRGSYINNIVIPNTCNEEVVYM